MHTYTISVYKNIKSKTHDISINTLDILISSLQAKEQVQKEQLMCFIGGKMLDNSTRKKENVEYRSLLTYDIDTYDGTERDLFFTLDNLLEGYDYVYYTTSTHQYNAPRVRVCVGCNQTIKTELYETISKIVFEKIFNGTIVCDQSTHEVSRLMYVPNFDSLICCSTDNNYECKPFDIAAIDFNEYSKNNKALNVTDDKDNLVDTSILNISKDTVKDILEKYKSDDLEYKEWLCVAMGLSHQFNGSSDGLNLFVDWSLSNKRLKTKYITQDKIIKEATSQYKRIKNLKKSCITLRSVLKNIKAIDDLFFCDFSDVANIFISDDDDHKTYTEDDVIQPWLFPDYSITKNKKDEDVYKLKKSFRNYCFILEKYKFYIKYDFIKKEKKYFARDKEITKKSLKSRVISVLNINGLTKTFFEEMHDGYVDEYTQTFNIMNYFIGEWDGVDRLNSFFNTLVVDKQHEDVRNSYMLAFFKQCLYILQTENYSKSPRYVLALQGAQGAGKSSWVRSLLPLTLHKYIVTGVVLNLNKEHATSEIVKNVFCEICELGATKRKNDFEHIKAFLTSNTDSINDKYEDIKKEQRVCSFVCTFNDIEFFEDSTGSSRFLTLPIKSAIFDHSIDMSQIFAQIKAQYDVSNFVLDEAMIKRQNELNKDFYETKAIQEDFYTYFCFVDDAIRNKKFHEYTRVKANLTEVLQMMGYEKTASNFNALRYQLSKLFALNNVKPDRKKKFTILDKNVYQKTPQAIHDDAKRAADIDAAEILSFTKSKSTNSIDN